MQVVNGYLCRDCADVAKAQKGIDPAHPSRAHAVQRPAHARSEPGTAGTLAAVGDVGTRLHVIA